MIIISNGYILSTFLSTPWLYTIVQIMWVVCGYFIKPAEKIKAISIATCAVFSCMLGDKHDVSS